MKRGFNIKKGFAIGAVFISLVSIVSCGVKSTEIIIKEDVSKEEDIKNKLDISIEPIENKTGKEVEIRKFKEGEYYGPLINIEDNKTTIYPDEYAYKINKENKIEKATVKYVDLEERLGVIGEGTEKLLLSSEEGKEIFRVMSEDKDNLMLAAVIKGDKETIFMNDEGADGKNNFSFISINSHEKFKLEEKLNEPVIEVFYFKDNYYALSDKMIIYKIKKEKNSLRVIDTINLINEFGMGIKGEFYLVNIQLSRKGEFSFGIRDMEGNIENYTKGIYRYNLETGEKFKIKEDKESGLTLGNYCAESNLILLNKNGRELYLGKVVDDTINSITPVDLNTTHFLLASIVFNDKGDELVLGYYKDREFDKICYSKIKVG